ncbi:MAG: hypothetical protein ACK6DC_24005 [Planctomycetota bacterium]|jgi:hypothetical protein
MKRVAEWDVITEELIRTWAFDPDLLLLEQDEDLLLCDEPLVPCLLELADNNDCPKNFYIYATLCQYSRELMTRGKQHGREMLRRIVSTAETKGHRGRQWLEYSARLIAHLDRNSLTDSKTADQIAHDLLIGIAGRFGDLENLSNANESCYRYRLKTSVEENLTIEKSTGQFAYTPWYDENANLLNAYPEGHAFWRYLRSIFGG